MGQKRTGEHISIRVERWLTYKGYILASCSGMARMVLVESDSIGLLIPSQDNSEPGRCPFVCCGVHGNFIRGLFVGTIWLDNYPRGANNKKWIFEVYGKEYFKQFEKLAQELSSRFNVEVISRLIQEQAKTEIFASDNVPV